MIPTTAEDLRKAAEAARKDAERFDVEEFSGLAEIRARDAAWLERRAASARPA